MRPLVANRIIVAVHAAIKRFAQIVGAGIFRLGSAAGSIVRNEWGGLGREGWGARRLGKARGSRMRMLSRVDERQRRYDDI